MAFISDAKAPRYVLLQPLLRRCGSDWVASISYALGLFVCLRLAFSLYAFLFSGIVPLSPQCTEDSLSPAPGNDPAPLALLGIWRQWDACWYQQIALVGYLPDSPSVAYFPLFPLLMRLVGIPLTGLPGGLTLAGMIVSSVAYIAAIAGFHRLISRDFGEAIARRAGLLLSIFPSAFYLFIPYTEALFLALAVWALYAARHGYWVWGSTAVVLATLTRTQGVLLILPLLWEFVHQQQLLTTNRRRLWLAALLPVPPTVTLAAFIGYTNAATGWTTFQAQSYKWAADYVPPWELLGDTLHVITQTGNLVEGLNLALLLGCLALFCAGLRRLPLAYSLYVAPQLFLLIVRQTGFTPLSSVNRYLLVLVPLFVVLALYLTGRWQRLLWIGTSIAGLLLLTGLFLIGAFVA